MRAYVGCHIPLMGPVVHVVDDWGATPLDPAKDRWLFYNGPLEWGHAGPSARQLGFAILYHATDHLMLSLLLAESFTFAIVAKLGEHSFTVLHEAVIEWILTRLEEELCPPEVLIAGGEVADAQADP